MTENNSYSVTHKYIKSFLGMLQVVRVLTVKIWKQVGKKNQCCTTKIEKAISSGMTLQSMEGRQ